ncbi:MAG: lipoyl(octanoyl) transferase LipB [bacterium]
MEFEHRWLGRIGYDEAHALQRALVEERASGRGRNTLLTLEHDPVMTLGRNADPSHLLLAESEYLARGIAVRHVERGGQVTYHGPGHLVMYPIVALRQNGISLRTHIRALEAALIAACAAFGIAAERRDGAPGCWVGERKIGAVGVRVERGVAWHGLALNVGRDLAPFDLINPCGHAGVVSTSIALEQDWAATARGERDAIGTPAPDLRSVADLVARAYQSELVAYGAPTSIIDISAVPAAAGGSR